MSSPRKRAFPARRPMDEARLRIARLSSSKTELRATLREICRISAETLGVERAGIWLYNADRTFIRCTCLYENSKRLYSEGAVLHVADFPDYFANLQGRKTIPAEIAAEDPRTSELETAYLAPLGISSILDAPILVQGEVHGVACNEHVGPMREWTTEERDFAGSVADMLALKFKGAELEEMRELLHDRDSDRAAAREKESMARIAAGVAHDFRNFLTVIISGAHHIQEISPPESDQARVAHEILKVARSATDLTSDLMAIGRTRSMPPQILNPSVVIQRFLHLVEKAVGTRHRIDFSHSPHVGKVLLSASQLERVVLNLVLNARDAMPDGGPICVSVTEEPGEPAAGDIGQVIVTIRDRGKGIPAAVMDRIFDPYFTTKPSGCGTGLGLTMVRQVVEDAGGSLQVESHPGAGATFRVLLPRVAVG